MTLFWRLFLANGAVLLIATAVLAFTPATVSYPVEVQELAVVVAGLVTMLALNAYLVTSALRPLGALREAVDDLETPLARRPLPVVGDDEVARVTAAFNDMTGRLEEERRRAAGMALRAQEDERRRVSRELHDGVGQTMTVLLLHLKALSQSLPRDADGDLQAVSDIARQALHEVRTVSRELRPGSLEDLGLRAALKEFVRDMAATSGIRIDLQTAELPAMSDETELVIYRIVQESLTNVVRHSNAATASVLLASDETTIHVTVRDDGQGFTGRPGTGMNGMAERARIMRGDVDVESQPGQGTTVSLSLPVTPPEDPA